MKVTVVSPAYNEQDRIGDVVSSCLKYVDSVIVVNDASVDETGKEAAEAGAVVVTHEKNKGLSGAINSGISKAKELGFDCVVIVAGDGQHEAKEIPRLLEPIKSGVADIVLSTRLIEGKNKDSEMPVYREIGNRMFTWLINSTTRLNVTDALCGMKALSRKAMDLDISRANRFEHEIVSLYEVKKNKLRIKEVPIKALYHSTDSRSRIKPLIGWLKLLKAILRENASYMVWKLSKK